jgi:hypothetical protein
LATRTNRDNTIIMARQTVITRKKKRGPAATGKGVLIGVRLQPPALAALDALIDTRPEPKPTRPEAIRQVLDATFKLIDDGNAAVNRNLATRLSR